MKSCSRLNGLYVGFALMGDQDATGQTLNNIFSGCKDVKILQACMDYAPEYHQSEKTAVFLSSKRSRLYSFIKSKYRHSQIKEENLAGTINTSRVSGSAFVNFVRGVLDILPRDFSEEDYHKIESFCPSFIYTLGENISTCKMALQMSYQYDIPIVLHVMDNLEDSFLVQSPIQRPFRQIYLSLLNKVFSRTIENIAIGDKMAHEYEKRHKQPFTIAMNCLSSLHEQPLPQNERLKILFSGGLHGGRANTLIEIADIIKENVELSNNVEMLVYTSPQHIERFGTELKKKCIIREFVPKNKLFSNLGQADILLHVESFDEREVEFFRYSMSTKIPEYMSVGRPILCFGPRDVCTVDYVERKKVGIVAETKEEFEKALILLSQNEMVRLQYGKRALEVAHDEHLQEIVSERITDMLMRVVKRWSGSCEN